MCPAHERDHPMAAGGATDVPQRPGGGTYPVRPVVSMPHRDQPPPERPAKPPPRPVAPYATTPRASPRNLLTIILIGLGLVTMVLLALATSGYIPDAGQSEEPPAELPTAAPDS